VSNLLSLLLSTSWSCKKWD